MVEETKTVIVVPFDDSDVMDKVNAAFVARPYVMPDFRKHFPWVPTVDTSDKDKETYLMVRSIENAVFWAANVKVHENTPGFRETTSIARKVIKKQAHVSAALALLESTSDMNRLSSEGTRFTMYVNALATGDPLKAPFEEKSGISIGLAGLLAALAAAKESKSNDEAEPTAPTNAPDSAQPADAPPNAPDSAQPADAPVAASDSAQPAVPRHDNKAVWLHQWPGEAANN